MDSTEFAMREASIRYFMIRLKALAEKCFEESDPVKIHMLICEEMKRTIQEDEEWVASSEFPIDRSDSPVQDETPSDPAAAKACFNNMIDRLERTKQIEAKQYLAAIAEFDKLRDESQRVGRIINEDRWLELNRVIERYEAKHGRP